MFLVCTGLKILCIELGGTLLTALCSEDPTDLQTLKGSLGKEERLFSHYFSTHYAVAFIVTWFSFKKRGILGELGYCQKGYFED